MVNAPVIPFTDQKVIPMVEDDPSILKFVSTVPADCNYRILPAVGGGEALLRSRECDGTIHLFLSDFQMPGITDVELATEICALRPDMKILPMPGFTGGMLILNEAGIFSQNLLSLRSFAR